ncbi:RNA polymerase sigma factor [Aeromicrobium sp. CF3.5]|uniref:RNA polymerase sigma factor n=1 Tax=Aeromicrobium sp. CF3.5 TaxID=3373078 RepID=UPI003EE55551
MADVGFDVRAAYAEHGRDLLGFAINATGDRGMAEECVQEAFTKAWQARERFDPQQASTRTWLFAITRNVITDHLRARARRPVRIVADAGQDVAAPTTVGQVDDHVTLVWALAQVSELHRRVVVAVRLEGFSYEQLSERDGVPVATLRTRMFHGLRALRDILDGAQHDEADHEGRKDRS